MAGKCGFIYSLIITVESSQIKVIGKWTRLGTMVDGHAHAGTVHYVILCSCRCNAIDPGCSFSPSLVKHSARKYVNNYVLQWRRFKEERSISPSLQCITYISIPCADWCEDQRLRIRLGSTHSRVGFCSHVFVNAYVTVRTSPHPRQNPVLFALNSQPR